MDDSDSDSDQSVPDIFTEVVPSASFEICIDESLLEIEVNVNIETDEEKCSKFVELLNSATLGIEILNALKTLNNCGMKFGMSVTMNRVLKALGVLKLLNAEDMTNKWGKESKNPKLKAFKDKVESCITNLIHGSPEWSKVVTAILEGFTVEKKRSKRAVELVPFASVSHLTSGRKYEKTICL